MNKAPLSKMILLLIASAITAICLCGCKADTNASSAQQNGITKLSFKQALSFDYLSSLNGSEVTINGYLATSSPVDGSFIFLMNLPFQSCPFCVPNTSQLSNTIEVYPKSGQTFTYTNQAVKVTGTLAVAESKDKPFTDPYGYVFAFKLVDASYSILNGEDLSAETELWQKFAASDIISEINRMYDYVNFVCSWNEYFVNSFTDIDGNVQPGYYLYASDALHYIEEENGQYHYGYVDGYFDSIIAKIKEIDGSAFNELTENIESAKALAADALKELKDGNYTCEEQYVEKFNTTDYIYTITNGEELRTRMDKLYTDFSNWFGSWEL